MHKRLKHHALENQLKINIICVLKESLYKIPKRLNPYSLFIKSNCDFYVLNLSMVSLPLLDCIAFSSKSI